MEAQSKVKGLQKIAPNQLSIGMYVAQLDRDWKETNFPVQGFYVRNQKSIARLDELFAFVYVDPRRFDSRMGEVKLRAIPKQAPKPKVAKKLSARERLVPKKPVVYTDQTETGEEMSTAATSLDDAQNIIRECVVKLQSNGGFDVEAIEEAITPLVQSVMRNQTALAALTRMRNIDDYLYSHAISCAVWGSVVGRQIGLPPTEINKLAMACSLADIGKTLLPPELLSKPTPPDEHEWRLLRDHVERGADLLESQGVTDHRLLAAIRTHHERHDGSGYPNGLQGNKIPAFGRIAGLIDSYDAMISTRAYAPAKSSYQAIQEISASADIKFQRELVEYFIKSVGVFPVGSIIELNTGEVGVVISQSSNHRLKPKIMLILEASKQRRNNLVIVDLSLQQKDDPAEPLQWWITKELPVNAYGIDPQKYFLD